MPLLFFKTFCLVLKDFNGVVSPKNHYYTNSTAGNKSTATQILIAGTLCGTLRRYYAVLLESTDRNIFVLCLKLIHVQSNEIPGLALGVLLVRYKPSGASCEGPDYYAALRTKGLNLMLSPFSGGVLLIVYLYTVQQKKDC